MYELMNINEHVRRYFYAPGNFRIKASDAKNRLF